MNSVLVNMIEDFLKNKITANQFVDIYIDQWKVEARSKAVLRYNNKVSGALSTSFCSADQYNPDKNRHESEIDETTLKEQIAEQYKIICENWTDPS